MARIPGWKRKREDLEKSRQVLDWLKDDDPTSAPPAWLTQAAAEDSEMANALDRLKGTKDHRSKAGALAILEIIGLILSILTRLNPKAQRDGIDESKRAV
jgi:hypothetical protein